MSNQVVQTEKNSKRRCWGLNDNLRRCGRWGNWKFFCADHRTQPFKWAAFILFTVIAGTASIQSAWFPFLKKTPLPQTAYLQIQHLRLVDLLPFGRSHPNVEVHYDHVGTTPVTEDYAAGLIFFIPDPPTIGLDERLFSKVAAHIKTIKVPPQTVGVGNKLVMQLYGSMQLARLNSKTRAAFIIPISVTF